MLLCASESLHYNKMVIFPQENQVGCFVKEYWLLNVLTFKSQYSFKKETLSLHALCVSKLSSHRLTSFEPCSRLCRCFLWNCALRAWSIAIIKCVKCGARLAATLFCNAKLLHIGHVNRCSINSTQPSGSMRFGDMYWCMMFFSDNVYNILLY